MTSRVLVWDLPTRLFHWLLAASFAGAWLTAESERWRDIHVALGYTCAGLILFRLVWGFVGSRYARFSSFAAGPRRLAAYLASLFGPAPQRHVGHNPAGGWAVFALLGLGLLTSATGLLTFSDIGGHALEEAHEVAASAMLALVVVHICAVIVSSALHRENLVRGMLTGYKEGSADEGIPRPGWIVGAALVAALAAFWIATLRDAPPEPRPGAAVTSAHARHSDTDEH
ncbi:MAG TPA: cytochrome b/b6 domain-containing protein [Burkholderiales bacterium]|jgi:cytochrome b|nr:cytochrome b/b6 domain-containing protein [Burkholderiales bacterium]